MIGTINVRVSAGHPNMPLAPIAFFKGSSVTIGVIDVPRTRCGASITGCNVQLTDPSGAVRTVAAKLVGGVWCATFAACSTVGFVAGGLMISVTGKDETGAAAEWMLGEGDVSVMDPNGTPTPVPSVDVGQLADGCTMKEIRTKVNQIARLISGTATMLALMCAMGASKLEDIPGTNEVYTAHETDAAISAAVVAAGSVTPSQVGQITSNVVTKAYVESLGIESGIDTNVVRDIVDAATNDFERIGTNAQIVRGSYNEGIWDVMVHDSFYANNAYADLDGNEIIATYARKGELEAFSRDVSTVSNLVHAWSSYWGGDDVRLTVTNYYGSAGIPSLYLEQKMETNETHSSPWFKTIWDERTRWDSFLGGYQTVTNNIAQNLADRAWGVYDSSTGEYSPEGLLQVSQERVMIASGMAYQKIITTRGCAVWVLKATEPTTISGVTSNGFFRIEDGDGNALFEIVKGNKRTVGATATNLSMVDGEMVVTYNCVSADHPTLELCTDLGDADWKTEDSFTFANVSWSGESGAWVATVTPVGTLSALFVKASYEAGGNTYIKNNVASSLDKVVVGGVEYNVTVQTINGKKLLVLE